MCIHNETDIGYQNTNSSIIVENNTCSICSRNPRISRKSRNCLDEGMCGYFFHCIFGQKIEKSAN